MANLQGKQLANRTAYLKKQVDDLVSGALTAEYADRLKTSRTLAMTGDGAWSVNFDGNGNVSAAMTLANTGVAAGNYGMVTVDAKGRITSGRQMAAADVPALDWSKITSGKPTTLAGYGIADAASKAELQTAINNLVAGAPGALDTLKELSQALGNDGDFANTVTNQLAKKADRATTLAGYGITDAAWRDADKRVWGAAFRANKGDPADLGGDVTPAGFAFDEDGDTGLFATKSVKPGTGSAKLMLKIDNAECLAISSDGALYAKQYGWLHDKFAAKASTLAGYGIGDALPLKPQLGAVDLNTIIDDGLYHNPSNNNAGNGKNFPVAEAGMLFVFSEGEMVYQQYQCFADSGFWYRCRYQHNWKPWRRNADTATTLAGYGITDGSTKNELQTAINNLVAGAPGNLNTLAKLATALGGDPALFTNLNSKLAGKVDTSVFDGVISPRGYQKRPGGMVEQWFTVPFGQRNDVISFTYPLAMAEVYGIWITAMDAEGEVTAVLASPPTSTGGTLITRGIYGGPPDAGTLYIRTIGKL